MWICHRFLAAFFVLISIGAFAQKDSLKAIRANQLFPEMVKYEEDSLALWEWKDSLDAHYYYDPEQLWYTTSFYYGRGKYKEAQSAMRSYEQFYPDGLVQDNHWKMVYECFKATGDLDKIAPEMYHYIALHYGDRATDYYINVLYQMNLQKELQMEEEQKGELSKFILNMNTPENELKISLPMAHDQLILSRQENKIEENFYYSQFKNNRWQELQQTPFLQIREGTESIANMDASGRYLVYTKCLSRAWDAISGGGCDIYSSSRLDNSWAPPEKFGGGINTPFYDGQACISPDSKKLFFVSDREGGYGGKDIWYSEWDGNVWKLPKNMGPLVNSESDEIAPYLAEDAKSLFYSSNKAGNFDIYYYYESDKEVFARSRHLPAPINSPGDEISSYVMTDNGQIVVSTNYKNGQITTDFDFAVYPISDVDWKPEPRKNISGQMLSIRDLAPYYCNYTVLDENYQPLIESSFNNRGNGWYLWNIKKTDYVKEVELENRSRLREIQLDFPVEALSISDNLKWNMLLRN